MSDSRKTHTERDLAIHHLRLTMKQFDNGHAVLCIGGPWDLNIEALVCAPGFTLSVDDSGGWYQASATEPRTLEWQAPVVWGTGILARVRP